MIIHEFEDKTQTNSDKFRRAQALVVDHLNLNSQDDYENIHLVKKKIRNISTNAGGE